MISHFVFQCAVFTSTYWKNKWRHKAKRWAHISGHNVSFDIFSKLMYDQLFTQKWIPYRLYTPKSTVNSSAWSHLHFLFVSLSFLHFITNYDFNCSLRLFVYILLNFFIRGTMVGSIFPRLFSIFYEALWTRLKKCSRTYNICDWIVASTAAVNCFPISWIMISLRNALYSFGDRVFSPASLRLITGARRFNSRRFKVIFFQFFTNHSPWM